MTETRHESPRWNEQRLAERQPASQQLEYQQLENQGFAMLRGACGPSTVADLLDALEAVFASESASVLARSSRGHVYAARNVIDGVPAVKTFWQTGLLGEFLRAQLGPQFGLVRVLFFDKPPDRTWSLPWHKDTAIAVKANSNPSPSFSRPTTKAGLPHVIACDTILKRMLTLRLHLDQVTDENGPLRVIPQSHVSSTSVGRGIDAAVTVHASPGDVLAMRPLISHASGASNEGTRQHRRIVHLEFSADRELPDGYQWHDFIAPSSTDQRGGSGT